MFLTGIYFFKFKHIFKKARPFGEPSFYFMLIRNILESALFAVFRLDTHWSFQICGSLQYLSRMSSRTVRKKYFPNRILKSLLVVPKLNHVTLLSLSFSQTFIPVIIRLISQVTKEDPKQQRRKSQMPDDFDPKDLEAPKKNFWSSFLGGVFRILVVLVAILHFVLIGYNCYVQEMDAAWIAILYVYIIWSSVKYGANYMNFKDLSSKNELNQKGNNSVSDEPTISTSDSWVYHFFPEPNWSKDQMVETQYMRSFVASLLHIISKI